MNSLSFEGFETAKLDDLSFKMLFHEVRINKQLLVFFKENQVWELGGNWLKLYKSLFEYMRLKASDDTEKFCNYMALDLETFRCCTPLDELPKPNPVAFNEIRKSWKSLSIGQLKTEQSRIEKSEGIYSDLSLNDALELRIDSETHSFLMAVTARIGCDEREIFDYVLQYLKAAAIRKRFRQNIELSIKQHEEKKKKMMVRSPSM